MIILITPAKTITNLSENAKIGAKYGSYRKRTMIKKAMNIAGALTSKDRVTSNKYISRSYAVHKVHEANIMNSTPEQAEANKIITITKKSGAKKPLQHNVISKQLCDKPGCAGIMCLNLCGKFVQAIDVGHATHGNKIPNEEPKYISSTDLAGQQRTQYMVFYKKRPVNYNPNDDIKEDATKRLNDPNNAMKENYHTYEKFYDNEDK